MSRPWMKFYPTDWRADPDLRMCSIAARGLWMELLCLMHEANPRGWLFINGKALSDKQMASIVGSDVETVISCIAELESAGVFSRNGKGEIYSRRMIRDEEKAETDKANGATGGNPYLKRGVNPPDNGGDKAQKPEARTSSSSLRSEEDSRCVDEEEKFEEAWRAYPRREGPNPKKVARQSYSRALKRGATPEQILAGCREMAAHHPTPSRYVPQMATWLNQERFNDAEATGPPIVDDGKAHVNQLDARWPWCAAQYRKEHGKAPPVDALGGWRFPKSYWLRPAKQAATA